MNLERFATMLSQEEFFKATLIVTGIALLIYGCRYLRGLLICNPSGRTWIRGWGIAQLAVLIISVPITLHFIERGILLDLLPEFWVPLFVYYVSLMMVCLSVPEILIGDDSVKQTFGEQGLVEMGDARKPLSIMTVTSLSFWIASPFFSSVLSYVECIGVLSYNVMLIECLLYGTWVIATIMTFILSGALSVMPIDRS